MCIYHYSLRIDAPESKYELIDKILGIKSNYPEVGWGLELIENRNDEPIFFIEYFLSILKDRYDQLEKADITRDTISIWMLYEYESQCNMEFTPKDMYNLGKENIKLCISCWKK